MKSISRYLRLTLLLALSFNVFAVEASPYKGTFKADSYFTTFEGGWNITMEDNGYILHFADNFEAKKAPDLKVFLSTLPIGKITGKNAADPNHSILISKLEIFTGKVSIVIPEGIDPSAYQSVIVHCEAYAKFWGGSALINP